MAYKTTRGSERIRRTGNTSYVYGNAVRKAAVPEMYPERILTEPEKKRKAKEERERQKSIQHANRMGLVYTIIGSVVIAAIFLLSSQIIQTRSELQSNSHAITELQSSLNKLTEENNQTELQINSEINYDEIYDTAVNELGMVYPDRQQVLTYDGGVSEYVRQYGDIPSSK